MQDLKYLTIDELERFAENLRREIGYLQKGAGAIMTGKDAKINEDLDLLSHVEAEILERTLLGRDNDGGASD